MGVCDYGPGVLLVHQVDVFFGLAECYVGECLEDIEVGFCLSDFVVCVWGESHFLSYVTPSVVGVSVWGMGTLLSIIVGCRLYSSAWGVIGVSVNLEGETLILFELSHRSSVLM